MDILKKSVMCVILLVILSSFCYAEISSLSYKADLLISPSGGASNIKSSSETYTLHGVSVAQPVVGLVSSSNYAASLGFWHAFYDNTDIDGEPNGAPTFPPTNAEWADLTGTVTDLETSQKIVNAKVSVTAYYKNNVYPNYWIVYTDQNGKYSVNIPKTLKYDVSAIKQGYLPLVKTIPGFSGGVVDFSLSDKDGCEADCTFVSDEICHKECYNINSCSGDFNVLSVCDKVKSPSTLVLLDDKTTALCCSSLGSSASTQIIPELSVNADEIVKTEKIVFYNGQKLKMIVVTWK